MSFLDPIVNGVARALKTLTGSVDVSQAAAPTANQVLIATDATHAEWATLDVEATPIHLIKTQTDLDVVGAVDVLASPPAAGQTLVATGPTSGAWDYINKLLFGADTLTLNTIPDGSVLSRSGAGITGTTLANLTQNPYIFPPSSPDSWSDEFASGSADLATRGWEVYDAATGAILTRSGDIITPNGLAPAWPAGTYRSTIVGSTLYFQYVGVSSTSDVYISKASPGASGSYRYTLRIGASHGQPSGVSWRALFVSSRLGPASGTNYYYNGAASGDIELAGIRSNSTYGKEFALVHRLNTAAETTNIDGNASWLTTDVLNFDVKRVSANNQHYIGGVDSAHNNQILGGNQLFHDIASAAYQTAGIRLGCILWGNIVAIDYIRRQPQGSWFVP